MEMGTHDRSRTPAGAAGNGLAFSARAQTWRPSTQIDGTTGQPVLGRRLADGQGRAGDHEQALMFIRDVVGCDMPFASKVRDDANLRELLERNDRTLNKEFAPWIDLTSINEPADSSARYSRAGRKSRRPRGKALEGLGQLGLKISHKAAEAPQPVRMALTFKSEWLAKHSIISNAYSAPRFAPFWNRVAGATERPVGL